MIGWKKVVSSKGDEGLGIRDLDIMNQACIMKLGCKIINGDYDLWCRVLIGKYNVDESCSTIQAKSYDSKLWKAIVKTNPTLLEAIRWNIGDAKEIKFWRDRWVVKGKSIIDKNMIIPNGLRNERVCDLVGDDGDWN